MREARERERYEKKKQAVSRLRPSDGKNGWASPTDTDSHYQVFFFFFSCYFPLFRFLILGAHSSLFFLFFWSASTTQTTNFSGQGQEGDVITKNPRQKFLWEAWRGCELRVCFFKL